VILIVDVVNTSMHKVRIKLAKFAGSPVARQTRRALCFFNSFVMKNINKYLAIKDLVI
jgi:hypothetical protein